MSILDELKLYDSDFVSQVMRDFYSDKVNARNELEDFLLHKLGISAEGVDKRILDAFLSKAEVRAILFGSVISKAVAQGRGTTSRDAMDLLGWIPEVDTNGKHLPGEFLDGCRAKGHELYMQEIWEKEASAKAVLAELDMKYRK